MACVLSFTWCCTTHTWKSKSEHQMVVTFIYQNYLLKGVSFRCVWYKCISQWSKFETDVFLVQLCFQVLEIQLGEFFQKNAQHWTFWWSLENDARTQGVLARIHVIRPVSCKETKGLIAEAKVISLFFLANCLRTTLCIYKYYLNISRRQYIINVCLIYYGSVLWTLESRNHEDNLSSVLMPHVQVWGILGSF